MNSATKRRVSLQEDPAGTETTITEPKDVWKKLFVKAATEKKWFRELLEEVLENVKAK